ncbi:formate dehydrogenase subunit delta [Dongia sp.]|uniref:formate dehydrogenase subunit delta n=1 Tax=Dongia sp. TaxID=1977262 RepID=UPI0035B21986
MNNDRLVSMANQIADFFQSYPEAEAVEGIATHIKKFWDPRMRQGIFAHLAAGGAGLKPLTLKALQQLATQQTNLKASA